MKFLSFKVLALTALLLAQASAALAQSAPAMDRIKIATVGAADALGTATLYEKWLDYDIVETGSVTAELAASWSAPAMAGRPYALLQGKSGDDVYLRTVEVVVAPDYRAMTTPGWNAIEMIVESPEDLHGRLQDSPLQHVGGPAYLGGDFPTILATQYKGPSEELFYLTTETGDRDSSPLLRPRAEVDRPFIMVVAGHDARALTDFYVDTLGGTEGFFIESPIPIIARAQGLDTAHPFPMGFVQLREFSNAIEVDGYPSSAAERPVAEGELPPGVAMASFSVPDLDAFDPALFLAPPARHGGIAYGKGRSATLVGPAGELIELIEEARPAPAE